MDPTIRALRNRLGAYAKWAKTADRTEATAPARAAFLGRFYDETPDDLPHETRLQMAEAARRAFFTKLALKSALARRAKAAGRRNPRAGDAAC